MAGIFYVTYRGQTPFQYLKQAAAEHQAERFVLVSTGQVAEADTVLAASKRATEVLMQSMPKDTTIYSAVRLGRILSRYVSMFQAQIEKHTPIRVPDPEMTCSTLPASEVARLILQSMALGQGGEVFVLNMKDQVRIADMAREMIRLSGREPDEDITIQYTGLELGEQISGWVEPEDGAEATEHPEIMVLRPEMDSTTQNGTRRNRLPDLIAGLTHAVKTMDKAAIDAGLHNIVLEYTGSDTLTVLQVREKKARLRLVKKR